MRRTDLRNVAIIAHVDHGKTTLVDCMLRQSGRFRESQLVGQQILDSNDLERERGITILAKNIAIPYRGVKINIIDTPGHADFGGEVERTVGLADGALLLVDAAEGPMPQTRFVLGKAFERGVRPIVVINKIDRPDARPHEVLDEVLDLFISLGAEHVLDDFPHIFASSKLGYATADPARPGEGIGPLMDLILEKIPGPEAELDAPLRLRVTTLDWSDYVGRIAIGRVHAGTIRKGQSVLLLQSDERRTPAKIASVFLFQDLGRVEVHEVDAGDVCAVVGLEGVEIGDTIADPLAPAALPRITVDEPTLKMTFGVNSSPLSGREGKFLTTRHLRERLDRELEKNVALRVEPIVGTEQFAVAGRGVLHLSILIETMRRESYELSVGKPQVIFKEIDGVRHEPFESLVVEVPTERTGPVMELIGKRRGEVVEMTTHRDYTFLVFSIPARGLIGLRTRILNATQGTAVMHHRFEAYKPAAEGIADRASGVLVSTVAGRAVAYALNGLQNRAELFVAPGDEIYAGMIVGENSREGDMNVNPAKEKKLSNVRAVGHDENVLLKPARRMTLEEALEFVADDELVEITPTQIRLRKILLQETDRRRAARAAGN
ncbi:MAG: translational GTPase TypA [Pirellulales bacterium]|nr:translational GTPase TypA [Pirellulales bacterium]